MNRIFLRGTFPAEEYKTPPTYTITYPHTPTRTFTFRWARFADKARYQDVKTIQGSQHRHLLQKCSFAVAIVHLVSCCALWLDKRIN